MEMSTSCNCTMGMDSARKVALSMKLAFCMVRSACPPDHLVPVGFLKIFNPNCQRVPGPAAKHRSKWRSVMLESIHYKLQPLELVVMRGSLQHRLQMSRQEGLGVVLGLKSNEGLVVSRSTATGLIELEGIENWRRGSFSWRIGQLPTLNLLSYPLIPERQTIDFFIVMLILCRNSLIYLAIKHQLKFNRALKRQSNRINNLEIHFPIVRHFLCHFATGDSS